MAVKIFMAPRSFTSDRPASTTCAPSPGLGPSWRAARRWVPAAPGVVLL